MFCGVTSLSFKVDNVWTEIFCPYFRTNFNLYSSNQIKLNLNLWWTSNNLLVQTIFDPQTEYDEFYEDQASTGQQHRYHYPLLIPGMIEQLVCFLAIKFQLSLINWMCQVYILLTSEPCQDDDFLASLAFYFSFPASAGSGNGIISRLTNYF